MDFKNTLLTHRGQDLIDQAQVQKSITYNGTDKKLELSGDVASPGNTQYYGTNGSGTKGYYSLPAAGETNTASNVGTAGVGVYKQKTGVNLEFKKINAGSTKVTITDDTGNSEVDIDVAEANLTISNMAGTLALTHGGTGQTTANTALNALLPSQTSQTGKFLKTDGSNTSWAASTVDMTKEFRKLRCGGLL